MYKSSGDVYSRPGPVNRSQPPDGVRFCEWSYEKKRTRTSPPATAVAGISRRGLCATYAYTGTQGR